MESLLLIWKDPKTRTRYKIGRLEKNEENFIFEYVDPELSTALRNNFTIYPGFPDLNKVYVAPDLFPNISGRLPNKTRNDYIEILNFYDLDKSASDFEILKKTRGRLITDNFEFVPAFNKNKLEFEVAGTRYSKQLEKYKKLITVNLDLSLELTNYNGEPAIKIITNVDNKKIELGYVPRYYAKEIADLLENGVKYSAMIKNVRFNQYNPDEHITAVVKLLFD